MDLSDLPFFIFIFIMILNFTHGINPRLMKIIRSVVPTAVYLYCEYKYSRSTINLDEIKRSIYMLNDTMFLPSADQKFVYIHGKRINYSTIKDPRTNITLRGSIVRRRVQYCQWTESTTSSDSTYYKIWTNKPRESPSSRRINPQKTFLQSTKNILKTYVGDYLLDDSLFSEEPPLRRFKPSKEQIALFNISEMKKNYEYLGDGWFYHSYDSNLEKRLEKLSRTPSTQIFMDSFQIFVSPFISFRPNSIYSPPKPTRVNLIDTLFEHCKAGDQRMRYDVFAPESITAVGWLNDTVIQAKERNQLRIGSVAKGEEDLSTMLQETIANSKIYATLGRVILSIYMVYMIVHYSSDYKKRSWYSVMAGFGMLIFKGVLWGKQYYNPYYWMSALAFVICSYYVITNQSQAHNHRD